MNRVAFFRGDSISDFPNKQLLIIRVRKFLFFPNMVESIDM